ncbi:MAG: methionine gamma-lyase [Gammaproteobacteria bacterium]|nr:MAG: methionine gamma-lyase [Gammaproteobacteria bacterium]
MNTKKLGFDSKLIHAGDFEDAYGSAVTPIYQTSTFIFKNADHGAKLFAGKEKGFIYTRIGNPTIDALENKLAALENGYRGLAFASGMAAVNAVYAALLKAGDHMISTDAVYGPSRALMEGVYANYNIASSFVDTSVIENIEQAIRPNTKLLYIETPANPTIQLTDLKKACEIAHQHDILVCVDNTFCSPVLQKPIDFGVDIVLHSLTKFINGHADIVGGAVIAKDETIYNQLRYVMVMAGGNMDPHQAYMVIRGVKTLTLRVEKAQDNAQQVAEFLENHPKVAWVKYPGLKSFKQHELAKAQMNGFGSMISFGVKGGLSAGKTVMNNVKLALLAVSLGGVETLIQHPASMTHAGLSETDRLAAGISDDLIRYSIGIENVEDIIADIDQALHCIS